MTKTTAVAVSEGASQIDMLTNGSELDQFYEMSGSGIEGITAADVLMPRLTILQALSPQLKSNKPEYIPGAKAGQIVNTATNAVFDEIHVIPVVYQRRHIEWAPNRGGLVRDWGTDDSILAKCKSVPKPNGAPGTTILVTPDGNELVVAGTWYVINLSEAATPAFIAMTSSQWKPSRRWMTMATSERVNHPTNGTFQPPLFYRSYKLRVATQSKGDNDWFGWSIDPAEDIVSLVNSSKNTGLVTEAKALMDAVKAGSTVAQAEAFGDAQSEDSDHGAM